MSRIKAFCYLQQVFLRQKRIERKSLQEIYQIVEHRNYFAVVGRDKSAMGIKRKVKVLCNWRTGNQQGFPWPGPVINTGANPPPGVRKLVVWPWYNRAANNWMRSL
jgi:hypothetical protein